MSSREKVHVLRIWVKRAAGWRVLVYHEVALSQLAGREVDGDGERWPAIAVPCSQLLARLPEDPFAHGNDQPGLLGKRNEINRGYQASRGVLPTH